MECEVAVRKAGRVVNDRELSYKMQREIAILQALRHENVRPRCTEQPDPRAQTADAHAQRAVFVSVAADHDADRWLHQPDRESVRPGGEYAQVHQAKLTQSACAPAPTPTPPVPNPHPCPPPPDPRRYLVTEVHEMSLRELLINRPALDLEDIRLMACHLLRGLNVRGTCGGVFHASG